MLFIWEIQIAHITKPQAQNPSTQAHISSNTDSCEVKKKIWKRAVKSLLFSVRKKAGFHRLIKNPGRQHHTIHPFHRMKDTDKL